MSNSIQLCNGEILCDPINGQFSRSLTIVDSLVNEIDGADSSTVQSIDLHGNFAVPGFIDSHLHLTYGASGLGDIDLSGATSRESFLLLLAESLNQRPADSWIVASGWSEQILGELPDKSWLAELGEVPIICFSLDLHMALINDQVIDLLDRDRIATMPGSSRIPEGIVKEDALFLGVSAIIPEVDVLTKITRTRSAIQRMHEHGVTLVGTMETVEDIQHVLTPLSKEACMRFRAMCLDAPSLQAIECCSAIACPFLQVTGFKAFLDGSLGSRSAKMYEPWCDDESSGVWAGVAATNTFDEWLARVVDANFSPIVHAIGDQAVGLALDTMGNISKTALARIEHAQFIASKDMHKVEGKCFGVQPLHLSHDVVLAKEAVGRERMASLHNWRSMIDTGATLSFGSDWPVASVDPIAAMQVAIQQGLTPQEVMMMSTSTSADSLRTPLGGRLTVGSYGDVVILDRHPYECDWNTCPPSVIMTIVGGAVVFEGETTCA